MSDVFAGGLQGELERTAEGLVYRLAGQADVSGAEALRARLLVVLAAGTGDLVIDLAQVEFMDSSALAALLAVSFTAGAERRRVVVQRPSPAVRQLIELTGVERVLDIRPHDPADG